MSALSILTALGLIIVAANTAQPETRQFAVMGIGTSTCAVFANMYKGDPQFAEQQFFVWAQGYLSRFPLIARATLSLKAASCLIDGEAVACDGDGLPVFDRAHRWVRQSR